MKRMQEQQIIKDLAKKMVLIVGPRQAGKTWLAKSIQKQFHQPLYLNYDDIDDQKIINDRQWLAKTDLLIFDELHKKSDWKNYLKGVVDTKLDHQKILVTGSARLGVYHEMGDSLAGRFLLHHLLPLSPAEVHQVGAPVELDRFITHGGFPEPYLTDDIDEVKRWRMQYINSLIRTDVLEFETIQHVRSMQLMVELLRRKVGSPISYQSIAEDIGVSINTVKHYIEILEALYIVFRVPTFSKNIARSLLKSPKIYFFDSGLVHGDEGVMFENLVAVSLLKHVYSKRDYRGENYKLHYLRTKEGKEVDFAIICNNEIKNILEVKRSDPHISPNLIYFSEKYNVSAVQIVKELRQERKERHIAVVKAENYLKELDL